MPRIPDEVIERLKQEVSLERLAACVSGRGDRRGAARGVKLARHGPDLIGLPFRDDQR